MHVGLLYASASYAECRKRPFMTPYMNWTLHVTFLSLVLYCEGNIHQKAINIV